MGYTTLKQGNQQDTYYTEYAGDTPADLASLPTEERYVKPGSVAIVISTSDVYMLNSQREWVMI